MSFMTKLGRGLAAAAGGVSEALPGVLNQRAAFSQRAEDKSERERQLEISAIWRMFESGDKAGAAQEFARKGYQTEAARAKSMLTSEETQKLQGVAGSVGAAAQGVTAAMSAQDVSTAEGRSRTASQIGSFIPNLTTERAALDSTAAASGLPTQDMLPVQQAKQSSAFALSTAQKRLTEVQRPDQILASLNADMSPAEIEEGFQQFKSSLEALGLNTTAINAELQQARTAIQKARDANAMLLLPYYRDGRDLEGLRAYMQKSPLSSSVERAYTATQKAILIEQSENIDPALKQQFLLAEQQIDQGREILTYAPDKGEEIIQRGIDQLFELGKALPMARQAAENLQAALPAIVQSQPKKNWQAARESIHRGVLERGPAALDGLYALVYPGQPIPINPQTDSAEVPMQALPDMLKRYQEQFYPESLDEEEPFSGDPIEEGQRLLRMGQVNGTLQAAIDDIRQNPVLTEEQKQAIIAPFQQATTPASPSSGARMASSIAGGAVGTLAGVAANQLTNPSINPLAPFLPSMAEMSPGAAGIGEFPLIPLDQLDGVTRAKYAQALAHLPKSARDKLSLTAVQQYLKQTQ